MYNLKEDIGETNNLAVEYPDRVKELDQLIDDYLAEVATVVPEPNPYHLMEEMDVELIDNGEIVTGKISLQAQKEFSDLNYRVQVDSYVLEEGNWQHF